MRTISEFRLLPSKGEQTLKKTQFRTGYFTTCRSGVFEDKPCKRDLSNRCVFLVGYGKDPQKGEYWIIKNSLEVDRGEIGYMRIKPVKNQCGIAHFATMAAL